MPDRDSRALWEKLMLDGSQAGLAWLTILRRWDALRQGFSGFDPRIVAQFTEAGVERLMQDPGIIRARSKIVTTISNARAYLATDAAGEDFSSGPFHVSQRPANASGSPSRR